MKEKEEYKNEMEEVEQKLKSLIELTITLEDKVNRMMLMNNIN